MKILNETNIIFRLFEGNVFFDLGSDPKFKICSGVLEGSEKVVIFFEYNENYVRLDSLRITTINLILTVYYEL